MNQEIGLQQKESCPPGQSCSGDSESDVVHTFAGPAVEFEDGISRQSDIPDDNNVDIHCLHVEMSHLETDCDQIENKTTAKLAATMEIKDQVISQVTADRDLRVAELEKIYCSRGWRMLKILYRIEIALIPPNSRRRLFVRIVLNAVRHPVAYAKKLKPSSIRNFVAAVKQDGLENASLKLDRFEVVQGILSRTNIDRHDMKRTNFAPISFPAAENPSVSIIIPVYNHFSYTYGCLESILANTTDVSYEIIIADDCSTDRTTEIGQLIENIRVSRTPNNLGFLGNCNNAAKTARGQYIHFLNNDTNVQKGWLGSLIRLMEENPQVGMTGSKLVYADGRLQEAGGILWQDGHAWNYGRLGNADEPEFNYVKEVDYISGASILIRRSLWEEIGGFDTRYTPAYYEDTDLAFEVRRHGFKVVYQPASVVIHYEGVSNGTDTGSGLKSYQEKNFVKFHDKWADTLQAEHLPGPDFLFQARDRSRNRKHILVIDHYVPHFDQDAGSKCTFMYIRLFVKLGMQVTFLGDNFYPHEPYTSAFQQMGVEVLYGNRYANGWKRWFRQNASYFDYAYLNRPHIAVKYIDFIKANSSAKIIYFGHDLHYLREQRQYEIEKDPALLASSREWKKKEFDLVSKADVVYAVGSFEQQVLQEAFPQKTIRNIPVYFYDETLPENGVSVMERKDLLFVGGFSHVPNIDAVLWFVKDIFPDVQRAYPGIKLYVVGSKPPENVKALASEDVVVTGFISDEKLAELYKTCRLVVVPLRYGAGVKGKVIESLYYRTAMVTTSIGAEGLSLAENAFVVADGTEAFRDAVISLYGDESRLEALIHNSRLFIENNFTSRTAIGIVSQDIDLKTTAGGAIHGQPDSKDN